MWGEKYKEYLEAFLNAFPDGDEIPRMKDGDINVMVFQEWVRGWWLSVAQFHEILEYCMDHPEYDKDLFFGGVVDYLDTKHSKTPGVEGIMKRVQKRRKAGL